MFNSNKLFNFFHLRNEKCLLFNILNINDKTIKDI